MKVFFDTSFIVALLVIQHDDHANALSTFKRLKAEKAEFYVCTHSTAEIYRTLTKGVSFLNYSAEEAFTALQESVIPIWEQVALNEKDYNQVLERMKRENYTGAIIYDGLISQAASKIDADFLVTFNAKDFQRLFPENGADLIIPV